NHIYESVNQGNLDPKWLESVEYMDNIFPNLNYRSYRPLS
ncbi:MAG: 1,4-alpha-glucan branching protein domain-containing protein, partial [Cyanobacteria bacterium P01_E01_bin.48]